MAAMIRSADDGAVVVFAPELDNAGVIARRLSGAALACLVSPDVADFASRLAGRGEHLDTVVVTASALRQGGAAVVTRFKSEEPAWSALPVVLLAPPGAIAVAPWPHTTLLTQPTTARQLIEVVERAVHSRRNQHFLANASRDLQRAAFQDPLTGLPNRSALYERILSLQAERRGSQGAFAAIFVDLDDFKRINDAYGHVAGDEALRQVGAHLVASVRSTDYVARWGGDEFMVLLVGAVGVDRVAETVGRIGQVLTLRLQSVPSEVSVSFSVGHVDEILGDQTPDEILAAADKRMYQHKQARRSGPPGGGSRLR
jgi:diguanylate cyclase